MMFEAELQEEIGNGVLHIVEYLNAPSWYIRSAAISVLSSLGAYCMCPSVSPLLVS